MVTLAHGHTAGVGPGLARGPARVEPARGNRSIAIARYRFQQKRARMIPVMLCS